MGQVLRHRDETGRLNLEEQMLKERIALYRVETHCVQCVLKVTIEGSSCASAHSLFYMDFSPSPAVAAYITWLIGVCSKY